jgi:hypothetical protein
MIIGISAKIGSGKDLSTQIIQGLTNNPQAFDRFDVVTEADVKYKVWDVSKYKNVKFADKLKDMICILLDCTREQLEDQAFKEGVLPESWWYYNLGNGIIVKRWYYENDENNQIAEDRYLVKTTPRLLLQLMGTECGREVLHPDLWVTAVMDNYRPIDDTPRASLGNVIDYSDCDFPNWVISDMRFPNELEAVKDRKGLTIRIEREHCCGDVGFCKYGDGFNCAKPISTHPSETALDEAKFDYVVDNNGTIKDLTVKLKEILIKENLI